ncbi:hypothetical protein AVEN_179091-1 [Araneus ventricosus]|uniref:Uncharacterized protein n=2 Tax=Araneus ventricosus TaxID=182803 RepID=A0A4Y2BIA3_ARAVE|nr:hypothetical protein AVEN_193701-1 [Araneus ventricosus]GBL91991.1 hypothetical protein AVEN_124819-1 [Araneus ventricosus]GBL92032.1 hypothetical protein AVEN_179091-1 [Araneus ventricosus]
MDEPPLAKSMSQGLIIKLEGAIFTGQNDLGGLGQLPAARPTAAKNSLLPRTPDFKQCRLNAWPKDRTYNRLPLIPAPHSPVP